jgi:hypothetical protein
MRVRAASSAADKSGTILSRNELEQQIHGRNEEVESDTVELLIHTIRKKLGAAAVRNVRGVGWMVDRRSCSVFSFALCLIGRLRNVALARQLGERPLLLEPRVIVLLFLDDDFAPHLRMRGAAEFRAENLECSDAGGREPVTVTEPGIISIFARNSGT